MQRAATAQESKGLLTTLIGTSHEGWVVSHVKVEKVHGQSPRLGPQVGEDCTPGRFATLCALSLVGTAGVRSKREASG